MPFLSSVFSVHISSFSSIFSVHNSSLFSVFAVQGSSLSSFFSVWGSSLTSACSEQGPVLSLFSSVPGSLLSAVCSVVGSLFSSVSLHCLHSAENQRFRHCSRSLFFPRSARVLSANQRQICVQTARFSMELSDWLALSHDTLCGRGRHNAKISLSAPLNLL